MSDVSLAAPPTSFEQLSRPSVEEAHSRLMTAAKFASEDPVRDSERWWGWLTFQIGFALPLDLFTKLAESLDYLGYAETHDREGIIDAEAAVDHYRLFLRAMITDRLGPVRKAVR
jgi:hypothetical protein